MRKPYDFLIVILALLFKRSVWSARDLLVAAGDQEGIACAWRIHSFMRRLESDTVLDSVSASGRCPETQPRNRYPVLHRPSTTGTAHIIFMQFGGPKGHTKHNREEDTWHHWMER